MALEDLTGDKYINSLVSSNPVGNTDKVKTLDDHIRGIKNVLLKSFPNITGAVTATQTELNLLDGALCTTTEINKLAGLTPTTAQLNLLTGLTSSATELNKLDGATVTTTELNYLSGVTSPIQTQINTKAAHAVVLTAGDGLTGGGDLSTNRTFTLGTPGDVTSTSTNAVTATSHTHALANNAVVTAKIANAAVTDDKIAAGAVYFGKIAAGGVGTTQLADNNINEAKLRSPYGGTTYTVKNVRAAEYSTTSLQATPAIIADNDGQGNSQTVLLGGILTISADLKSNDAFRSSWLRAYVNGSFVNEMGQANTTYVTHTMTVTVNRGDQLSLRLGIGGGTGIAYARNVAIKSGGELFAVS